MRDSRAVIQNIATHFWVREALNKSTCADWRAVFVSANPQNVPSSRARVFAQRFIRFYSHYRNEVHKSMEDIYSTVHLTQEPIDARC